jgi:hypothetical protein
MPTFIKHRPSGLLGQYVESFWYRPGNAHAAASGMLVLPGGRAVIVISLAGASQTAWTHLDRGGQRRDLHHATVRLPHCAPVATAVGGAGPAFGVSFKPHGLSRFSRVALGSVDSDVAALEDVWGRGADELVERLAEAPTPASKFALMESALWNRLCDPHR